MDKTLEKNYLPWFDLVLCMIKIDEGRKFSKHSTINQSLYLKARFFSDTEHISSPVWWNSTSVNGEKGAESQPHFELHHVVPIETNLDFLEANCKQNHLVVEVWNFSEPSSNLIGVAMVPLHQLYATFSVSMIKTCSFENIFIIFAMCIVFCTIMQHIKKRPILTFRFSRFRTFFSTD